jgi:hypothetical protein
MELQFLVAFFHVTANRTRLPVCTPLSSNPGAPRHWKPAALLTYSPANAPALSMDVIVISDPRWFFQVDGAGRL